MICPILTFGDVRLFLEKFNKAMLISPMGHLALQSMPNTNVAVLPNGFIIIIPLKY